MNPERKSQHPPSLGGVARPDSPPPGRAALRSLNAVTTRYLICGRREDADEALLFKTLDNLILHPQDAVIIHGDARPRKGHGQSYDRLAAAWGEMRGVAAVWPFPADWDSDGLAAGPIRNRQMLMQGRPDVVIAFPGGPGTADMLRQAHALQKQRNTYGGPPLVVIEVTDGT